MRTLSSRRGENLAFTLVELLTSMAIAILLVILLVRMVAMGSSAWQHGDDQAEDFTNARAALDLMSRDLQGAVVNLDFGFEMQNGQSNGQSLAHSYSITFLTCRQPTVQSGTSSVMKVCYQLGWADMSGTYPQIASQYSAQSPTPVLIRTTSTYLDDVFKVTGTNPGTWVSQFASITNGTNTTNQDMTQAGGVTEIIAENVLGLDLHPLYWNGTSTSGQLGVATTTDTNGYYEQYLTSMNGPQAIRAAIAVVSTRTANLLKNFPGWENVFNQTSPDLYNLLDPDQTVSRTDSFNVQLRRNIQYFNTTIYLQSKTP